MIRPMFCHNCGAQVSDESQFCTTCGTPLTAGAATKVPVPAPPAAWTPPSSVRVESSRWISAGWQLVKADMGNYVLLAVVAAVLSSAVPVVLQGPMTAGMHIFTMKKIAGRRGELNDLFTGFNFFVPTLVASLLIGLFASIGMLLCIIPGLVVAAMYKFTYLFILDKRMDFWPAMQASHAVVKNDYVGFTLFMLLLALINLLGVLCCIVGVLVTIPLSVAAITVAYQEIVGFEPHTLETV